MTTAPDPTASTAPRCSALSQEEDEPLAGTAPEDAEWLLVEDPGPWGRFALGESRLPDPVRDALGALTGVRVQLIRRHAGAPPVGLRVFRVRLGATGVRVEASTVDSPEQLLSGDLALTAYDGPLWLVCTNGRRDVCCAERGRPVAAALAQRWPEATWETTHLGGHRFAATLLALPSGVVLGRLDPETALDACAALEEGLLPTAYARGRAGLTASAQAAELHVRASLGHRGLGEVEVLDVDGGRLRLATPAGPVEVEVEVRPGPQRRLSCADDGPRATRVLVPRLLPA